MTGRARICACIRNDPIRAEKKSFLLGISRRYVIPAENRAEMPLLRLPGYTHRDCRSFSINVVGIRDRTRDTVHQREIECRFDRKSMVSGIREEMTPRSLERSRTISLRSPFSARSTRSRRYIYISVFTGFATQYVHKYIIWLFSDNTRSIYKPLRNSDNPESESRTHSSTNKIAETKSETLNFSQMPQTNHS